MLTSYSTVLLETAEETFNPETENQNDQTMNLLM